MLIALFMNNNSKRLYAEDPFDTEYVIGLLQKEEKLAKKVRTLNLELESADEVLVDIQTQLAQTQVLVGRSLQKNRSCEAEKLIIIEDARDQVREQAKRPSNTPASCDAEQLEVSIVQAKVASLESLLIEVRDKFTQTQKELLLKNQLLSQIQNRESTQVDALKLENNNLKRALNEPIAIDSHYLSARFCNKPKFDSLICVQELLVRPSFTKPPITRLAIRVFDKSGNVVATGDFKSSQTQLFRLALGRGKELPSGDYMVEYTVDNQTLLSKLVELKQ